MSIKATFPAGVNEITVNGLHQWDYGRTLRIESADLPAIVEVHFACPGMREAIVRSCESTDGVAEAVIPEKCMEQTAPITAWVFAISDTEGMTIKTITLTITPRTRPQPGATVPEAYTDKYTELIAAVEDLIAKLKSGDFTDLVAEDLVHKAGDTMTGLLKMPAGSGVYHPDGSYSHYAYFDSDGNRRGELMITDKNCIHFNQRKTGSAYAERYKLPDLPTEDMTADQWYGIHTTKQPIAVAHGGTGATDAENARKYLGVPSRQDLVDGTLQVYRSYKSRMLDPNHLWLDTAGTSDTYTIETGDDPTGVLLVDFKYEKKNANGAILAEGYGTSVLSIPAADRNAYGTLCAVFGDTTSPVWVYAWYCPEMEDMGTTYPAKIWIESLNPENTLRFGIRSISYMVKY